MSSITTYCRITDKAVFVNGKSVFEGQSSDDFLLEVYRFLQIDYPKFHKMDKLSKTGFLGAELIKKYSTTIAAFADDEIALLFGNNHSSSEVDVRFEQSYTEGGMPSPALFVYTLPNIVIGEIAIRNKWYGENLFVVQEQFDASAYVMQCDLVLEKKAKAVLAGWINVSEKTDAFLFFAENKTGEGATALGADALNTIYKS